jgi:hypothetical protein
MIQRPDKIVTPTCIGMCMKKLNFVGALLVAKGCAILDARWSFEEMKLPGFELQFLPQGFLMSPQASMIACSFEPSNDLRGHGQLQAHVTNEAITLAQTTSQTS